MPLILTAASLALLLVGPPQAKETTTETQVSTEQGATKGKETKGTKDKKDKKPKKKDVTYPDFRLEDHPSIYFAKGTHLDFRARLSPDWIDSEAPSDQPAEVATIDIGKKRVGVSGEIYN